MLGRLQMSTPEAIVAYNELSESVFGLRKWRWKGPDKFKAYETKRIESGKSQHTGHLRLALCGLGGIGKTQDVLNFIYGVTQFEADYRKLGSLAKIPGHDDTKRNIGLIVKQWLEGPQSGEWILVIDNADNMLDFYPEPKSTESKEGVTVSIAQDRIAKFIPRSSKGTVIVTTRDQEVAKYLANQNVIIKPELSREQAIELFYQYYSNADESKPDDTAALPCLLLELQHLSLTIVQVAVYLDLNRSITASRYLEIFRGTKRSQKRLLSKPHHNIWRDQMETAETTLTTFSIRFQQIPQQSKLADSFLRFMACIDRKAIPRDLLFQINIDGIEGEAVISEALDKLVNSSILRYSKIDCGSGQVYEIHSLVHLAMQTDLESSELDNALAKTSTAVADTLTDSRYENCAAWRVYLPHTMGLLANLVEDSETSANLCEKVGWHLIELGRYSESLILCERARKLYIILFGEEHTKTLDAMHLIGSSFAQCGRLKEAQKIHDKVLTVRRPSLGEDHRDTLNSIQGLAITYKKLGGRSKEVQEQEKVLEVSKRTLGKDRPDTADAMYNSALTLYNLEPPEEAISLTEDAASSFVRIYGTDHPRTKSAQQALNGIKSWVMMEKI
ncbi:hypothetical protein FPQ18DRAFT_421006 [Pyronema domesticum]|nr:hypothetical protein FPQ18DRAFT_421006 [Pyronema domesticum]